MNPKSQIESWLSETRERIDSSEEIPKINADDEWPWTDAAQEIFQAVADGSDIRRDLLEVFREEPANLYLRFIGLHLYGVLWLANFPEPVFIPDAEDEDELSKLEDIASGFAKDRVKLLELLPIESCEPNWRFISWEIHNSYLLGSCKRALKLYDLVEGLGLLDPTEFRALRGASRFFVGSKAWPRDWTPVVRYRSRDLKSFFYMLHAVEISGSGPITNEVDVDLLRDAAADIETAIHRLPDLSDEYRVILARCYTLLGRHQDAAREYKKICGHRGLAEAFIEGLSSLNIPDLDLGRLLRSAKSKTYDMLAVSYLAAGQRENAVETLEKWALELPQKGIHSRAAVLHADAGDYQKAYESLRKEVDVNPKLEEDLSVRIALALGGAREIESELSARVQETLESHPEVTNLVDSLLSAHWNAFKDISDQSKQEWRSGVVLMYYMPSVQPALTQQWLEKAAASFAKAVELQIRSTIFEPFRNDVRQKDLAGMVEQGLGSDESSLFCKYLKGLIPLTFGQMAYAIDQSERSNSPILKEFNKWLRETKLALLKKRWILQKIRPERGSAVHASLAVETAAQMSSWCRDILGDIVK